MGVSDPALLFAIRALRRRSPLWLDHHERLIRVGTCGDSMASYATLTGVFDTVD